MLSHHCCGVITDVGVVACTLCPFDPLYTCIEPALHLLQRREDEARSEGLHLAVDDDVQRLRGRGGGPGEFGANQSWCQGQV